MVVRTDNVMARPEPGRLGDLGRLSLKGKLKREREREWERILKARDKRKKGKNPFKGIK